jgi:hypothetical protein
MAKKKLLYVCPHLSTGGQPQYTYKQVKHFINEFHGRNYRIPKQGFDKNFGTPTPQGFQQLGPWPETGRLMEENKVWLVSAQSAEFFEK